MRATRLLRNRLVGALRRVAEPARRWRAGRRVPMVPLAAVQRRLELLLEAMYGEPLRVVARSSGAPPLDTDVALPAWLPGGDDAIETYRVMAIQQAARIARGTRRLAPDDPLERDLYLVLEGAMVDAEVAARAPGLVPALRRLRGDVLEARPGLHRFLPQQREVEQVLRAALAAEPGAELPMLPRTETTVASAEAARSLAARIRAATRTRIPYRALTPFMLWDDGPTAASGVDLAIPVDSVTLPVKVAGDDEPSDRGVESDTWERGGAEPDDSPLGESSGGAAAEVSVEMHDEAESEDASPSVAPTAGVAYPEWIARHGRLAPRHVTVRVVEAAERDDAWAREALREHGPLLRQVRDRFSLLRAHRLRLRAQRSGDELDLDACIGAVVDRRMGRVPTDRLYQTTRATRHALAIAILVDVSGSTKTALPDGRTVLDVERLSLLLASEALDALGDPYAIYTFSGLGRHDVRIATVKNFAEHDAGAVQRRISSLEPEDNTRLGAALRHATAMLQAQPAGRRVLLILSDGRPNDVDRYQGMEAIEDSRQAVLAARAAGVLPFCLTVDSEEADYLPHLFGQGGYRVITEPGHLPAALVRLVERLLRA